MKKIFLSLVLLTGLFSLCFSAIGERWCVSDEAGQDLVAIDSQGNMTPRRAGENLGSMTAAYRWATIYSTAIKVNVIDVSSYTIPINCRDYWMDLPVASSITFYSHTSASGTWICGAGKTWGVSTISQAAYGRSVTVWATVDAAEDTVVSGTATVYGIDCKGNVITEAIGIPAPLAEVESLNAFMYVSSVTFKLNPIGASTGNKTLVNGGLGTGTKIGLSNDLVTTTDIIVAGDTTGMLNQKNVGTVNATYDTIAFTNAPNSSKDYVCLYYIRKAP